MKSKLIKSLYLVFILLGLIPLLPFYYKPIGLILGLLISIIVFIYNKKITFSFLFFNNILLFLLYLISYFASDDKIYALKYIETSLPLLLFPLFFLFISSLKISIEKWQKLENLFYKSYVISSVIYSFLIFFYIYHLGYFSGEVTYDLCISWLRAYFWGFQNALQLYLNMPFVISILNVVYHLQEYPLSV